ncbi:MAG: hypothetical protein HWE26_18630 [Alteromonadaceae bacterium]|nr:hypothetical protein [Alteromonadaceae bacterium]
MTNTLFITLQNDAAAIERVLQCARFRRFTIYTFSGESTKEQTFLTLKVSGSSAIEHLIAQMRKMHCVREVQLQ